LDSQCKLGKCFAHRDFYCANFCNIVLHSG
jgi:hypothetical protein